MEPGIFIENRIYQEALRLCYCLQESPILKGGMSGKLEKIQIEFDLTKDPVEAKQVFVFDGVATETGGVLHLNYPNLSKFNNQA